MDLLAQMATFVRVVESGSLSAAARAQGLSLAAVSRQLQALETELAASLIVRSTRRLRVTDAGRVWHAHCTRILRDVTDARQSVARGGRGSLRVSVSFTMGMHQLVPKLPALLRRHPGLALDLRFDDHAVDLVSDDVDVVVRAGLPVHESTSLIARPLLESPRVAVAAPSYLRVHGVPREPESLAAHEALVQLTASGSLRTWHFARGTEQREVNVRGRLRMTAPLAILAAARAGLGIAMLPSWLVADDLAAGELRRVLAKWDCPRAPVWALYRVEARGSALIRAFIEGLTA